MGWKEEAQFRFGYTSDGASEMAWQPTSVYVPDKPEKSSFFGFSHRSDAKEIFLFFSSVIITTLAYQYVNHIEDVAHLSAFLQKALLGMTTIGSFLGSMVLLDKKIIQTIIKGGIVVLCLAIFLLQF